MAFHQEAGESSEIYSLALQKSPPPPAPTTTASQPEHPALSALGILVAPAFQLFANLMLRLS